jgi:hypothetical protein
MKKILALLFCTTCMLQEIQAQSFTGVTILEKQHLREASFMGPTQLKEITAKSISVMGPFQFNHLEVEKDTVIEGPVANSEHGVFDSLEITGPLVAKNVACSKLDATGPVDVTELSVSGEATITGPLKASKSTFQNLTIWADEISLEDIKIKDILVKNNKGKKQVLHLKGKTVVTGNIIFESGKGTVEQGSEVNVQGEIKGATVEKK